MKKKKNNDLQVSLFPFLSILACVLGILTLMITAVVIAQIDPEAVNEKIETALEEDEEFQKKMDEQKAIIEKIRNEIKSIRANPTKKIDPAKKEKLVVEIAAIEKKKSAVLQQNKKSTALKAESQKVSAEIAILTENFDEAEEEWDLMKDPNEFETMVVKQSGSGVGGDLEPTFIECRDIGIRVYEGKDIAYEVKTSEISNNPKLQKLVKMLAKEAPYRSWQSAKGSKMDAQFIKRDGSTITLKDKKGKILRFPALQLSPASRQIVRKYEEARKANRPDPEARFVIFLVRSKGIAAWYKATQVCAKYDCRFGHLPLDGEGEIDLSLFSGS
ncbi:MAG: hypothetical protein O3A82_04280 [Verrucomicrobia bacterium]|nr:hypothetical protein [Verrucomicrobiota bacterium]MDA1046129.1 hypothetical protein [Verrucomicrobiota bacterium]